MERIDGSRSPDQFFTEDLLTFSLSNDLNNREESETKWNPLLILYIVQEFNERKKNEIG